MPPITTALTFSLFSPGAYLGGATGPWPKTGLNLSEDLFFWSSPKFGQENGFGFGLENFHSDLHYSQIF